MSNNDEITHLSAEIKPQEPNIEKVEKKNAPDSFSLAITTFGVGYLPLAPGTWGAMVGVGIYLLFGLIESNVSESFGAKGWTQAQITAWIHAGNLLVFLIFNLLGIWAADRATILFKTKDPSQAVVDEVIGQIIVFLFIPFSVHWTYILAGFLLFRLFDIWKPYPIDSLQNLPAGIGVCADDILAGVYGGICLALLYALRISF